MKLRLEEGWSTLLLVGSLVVVAAMAIVTADFSDGAQVLVLVGITAVLAGVLLAKSNFPGRRAHLISLIYGLAIVAFFVGRILPGDLTWRLRIFDLVQRQVEWMGKASSGGTSRDSIIFVLQTSAIFWLLGYTASWYTFREPHVWRVVLPSGLVLLSVVYYYHGPKPLVVFLGIYALLALLYVTRTHLVDRQKSWRQGAVRFDGDINFDFLRASFLMGALLLLLAGNLPALGANAQVNSALSGVDQPWRRFQDDWTRLFSSLRSYGTGANDAYSDSMVLGGPRKVGNTILMDIYVPERLASVYWQGVVYDTYRAGGEWRNSTDDTSTHYPDDGLLKMPSLAARQLVTQTVVNYMPNSSTLYGAPEVIGSDQQMLVDTSKRGEEDVSINWLRSRYIMRQGDQYEVVSRVSTADKSSLRQASTDYPQWVSERYLQLPGTITEETKALALELTEAYDNPFDKAIVIRNYLRQEITYNDQIQAPPPDVEPVHYILFEGKEAYCTYYASAMAVMLRSLGIPARIVNGFAQGEFKEEGSFYRVRASNAHTWVEVYFPGYGWIQFEPTASIPVIERPDTPLSGGGDAFGDDPLGTILRDDPLMDDALLPENQEDVLRGPELAALEAELAAEARRARLARAFGGGLILLVAAGLATVANRFNHRVEGNVERSYGRLAQWARWLGIPVRSVDTPYERADRLAQVVPEGRRSIRHLTHQYVLRRFSAHHNGDEEFSSLKEWQELRPLLLRKAIVQRLQRLRRNGD